MKLYYHKTDGGAEYYCLRPLGGSDEGDMRTAILRTDGGEIELYPNKSAELGVNIIIEN